MVIVNMAACQVSICLGLKGPVASPVAACATGLVAIGEAARRLQFGEADVLLAGGAESVDTPVGMAAFARLHAYRIPISSNKPAVGHMLGAAGAFSVAVVFMTIEHNVAPPTANLENPDPACDLDYMPGAPREVRVDVGLANAFGFGGQNACVVLRCFTG